MIIRKISVIRGPSSVGFCLRKHITSTACSPEPIETDVFCIIKTAKSSPGSPALPSANRPVTPHTACACPALPSSPTQRLVFSHTTNLATPSAKPSLSAQAGGDRLDGSHGCIKPVSCQLNKYLFSFQHQFLFLWEFQPPPFLTEAGGGELKKDFDC